MPRPDILEARGPSRLGSSHMPQEYLTLKDVAELLKLSEKTIYRLAQAGRLPGFKAGGQWRFDKSDIESWTDRQKQSAASNAER